MYTEAENSLKSHIANQCFNFKELWYTNGNSPDLVASLHSDPLRNGPVLFLLLSEKALDPEGFVGRLKTNKTNRSPSTNLKSKRNCTQPAK